MKMRSVTSIVESVRKQRALLNQTFLKLPPVQWIQSGDVTRLGENLGLGVLPQLDDDVIPSPKGLIELLHLCHTI
jgi:hypothetical protein